MRSVVLLVYLISAIGALAGARVSLLRHMNSTTKPFAIQKSELFEEEMSRKEAPSETMAFVAGVRSTAKPIDRSSNDGKNSENFGIFALLEALHNLEAFLNGSINAATALTSSSEESDELSDSKNITQPDIVVLMVILEEIHIQFQNGTFKFPPTNSQCSLQLANIIRDFENFLNSTIENNSITKIEMLNKLKNILFDLKTYANNTKTCDGSDDDNEKLPLPTEEEKKFPPIEKANATQIWRNFIHLENFPSVVNLLADGDVERFRGPPISYEPQPGDHMSFVCYMKALDSEPDEEEWKAERNLSKHCFLIKQKHKIYKSFYSKNSTDPSFQLFNSWLTYLVDDCQDEKSHKLFKTYGECDFYDFDDETFWEENEELYEELKQCNDELYKAASNEETCDVLSNRYLPVLWKTFVGRCQMNSEDYDKLLKFFKTIQLKRMNEAAHGNLFNKCKNISFYE